MRGGGILLGSLTKSFLLDVRLGIFLSKKLVEKCWDELLIFLLGSFLSWDACPGVFSSG